MTGTYRHDEIAKLAYEFWQRRGHPFGSPEIDWYAAENTLAVRYSQEQSPVPRGTL
jgi:hypothetical protein